MDSLNKPYTTKKTLFVPHFKELKAKKRYEVCNNSSFEIENQRLLFPLTSPRDPEWESLGFVLRTLEDENQDGRVVDMSSIAFELRLFPTYFFQILTVLKIW